MPKKSHKVDGRPSVQWYWDDWMTAYDLRRAGAFARGLWMDMLAMMWVAPKRGHLSTYSGQIMPADLSRIVGESEADVEQALSKLETEGVFSREADGTIYSRKMVRDDEQRQNKVRAGSMSHTSIRLTSEEGPSTPSSSSSPTSTPLLNDIQQEGFDRFWNAYPKRKSKGQAKKTWKKMDPDEELITKMLDAIEKQKQTSEWKKNDGKYIKYPSTWLNAEGWDDEISEPKEKERWLPPEERNKR